MDIKISKGSELPLRRQLAEQIVFQIATGKLRPGEALPSVRELARRLKIHHNTVSEAYQSLVRRTWLVRKRGSRLIVAGSTGSASRGRAGLDEVINEAIRISREQGYSLQDLRFRVRERLRAEPPDHILVVEEEDGLRRILEEEIRLAGKWRVASCSRKELALQPGVVIGALLTAPSYASGEVERFAVKEFPVVPLAFSDAEEQLARVPKLRDPSVVALVSVSPVLLTAARSLLAPALGERHTLIEQQAPLQDARALRAADLIFCDCIARRQIKARNCILYHVVDEASMRYLKSAMESYQSK